MSNIQLLINTRKYTRKLVTETFNKRDSYSILSVIERENIKSQITDYVEKLEDLDSKIQVLKWADADCPDSLEDELGTCEEYKSKLRQCGVLLSQQNQAFVGVENARSLLRNPIAPLPKYNSTEGEDLVKFFAEFEETTGKYAYPEYDKLLLLKQQISGRALTLVNSLETNKRGYSHAKELLLEALASRDTQIFNVIKQLVSMRLPYSVDPFEYISNARNLVESVNRLKITVDSFLQYFFWKGLNEKFQMQLVSITNHTRPSLKEIMDNFFEASERYVASQSKVTTPKSNDRSDSFSRSTTNLAVGVNYKISNKRNFRPCSLCSKLDGKDALHPIFQCSRFTSASAKIKQLENMKACLKCGNFNHTTATCKYKFNTRCRHCSGWHFSFLCLTPDQLNSNRPGGRVEKPNPKVSKLKSVSSNSVTITEALNSEINGGAILPTFSCTLESGLKLRALKDSGCQSNFILESIATTQNLTVLKDNVSLMINGINTSQHHITKIVEVRVNFGEGVQVMEALCIPALKINLNLPNLSVVVEGFKQKGYQLADDYLAQSSDSINKIQFILGSKNAYCLPDKDVIYGRNGKSVYSDTSLGIMLKGDIQQIIDDLNFLPSQIVAGDEVNDSEKLNEIFGNCPIIDHPHQVMLAAGSSCKYECDSEPPLPQGPGFNNQSLPVTEDGCQSSFNNTEITEAFLKKATDEALTDHCNFYTQVDNNSYNESESELNLELISFVLDHTVRNAEGRLIMPLLWNGKVSHLLGNNSALAKLVLKTNHKKLLKNNTKLRLYDDAIKEQESAGIIERVDADYLETHPDHSFLPHMGVFKLDRETTKCRVVFLSNLSQGDSSKPMTISHNQAIHSGPCLNQKLTSAVLLLRFDAKLLCFDLKKAFNTIVLPESDQSKVLFYWYRNVEKGDYSLVTYRNVRLPFGLRCSPTLLLLGLYKMLVLDTVGDSEALIALKKLIYQLSYMDNCAVSASSSEELISAYNQLASIFNPYHFQLQQFVTNDVSLQSQIDSSDNCETPTQVKLLGLCWDRERDALSTKPIDLNPHATTKRKILSSIASQFDAYNFNGPLLNRSRVFMHNLQLDSKLGWDDQLSADLNKEWRNIVKQANSAPVLKVSRCVGSRTDSYRLVAFSDSSKTMFGTVIYIQNTANQKVNFVMAKNRLVNKQLETKSIPSLELQGLALAAESVTDLFKELTSDRNVTPVRVEEVLVYSDSLVALSWLNSYSNKLEKMQKCSVFVLNRLDSITKYCETCPIQFSFVADEENPADCITRCLSFKQLSKSNYLEGPQFLQENKPVLSNPGILTVTIPNPLVQIKSNLRTEALSITATTSETYSKILTDCSSFTRLIAIYSLIFKFINKLKVRLKQRSSDQYSHFIVKPLTCSFTAEVKSYLIKTDQQIHYPDVVKYFSNPSKKIKDIPNIVKQLNIYQDNCGLLRVASKFKRFEKTQSFPLLLAKCSKLTRILIIDLHQKLSHAGCYALLSELRKSVWIPHYFSVVKKVLKECILCRRFHARPLKLNQSSYRDFRLNPPQIPYSYVYVDYLGPFYVKRETKKDKVWLLCITCMWSRAINLKLCLNMTVEEFLRAFQLHTFEFGLPQYCISDLGTQLVAGANVITNFLNDSTVCKYFEENNVAPLRFEQFYKGCSQLGSLVESCVKLTKKLLFGAIRNCILSYRDFEFTVSQTVHLVNRRPIAFKEALRDNAGPDVPEPITPECLIRGYTLMSVNIIPSLQPVPDIDEDWSTNPVEKLRDQYRKLRSVRLKLIELYHSEFVSNLTSQAVNRKDRYVPKVQHPLQVGDVVLIKEPFSKPCNYPMGLIKSVLTNANGEVTGAEVLKGSNREIVKRHSSTIIPLLSVRDTSTDSSQITNDYLTRDPCAPLANTRAVSGRKAAVESRRKTKVMLEGAPFS